MVNNKTNISLMLLLILSISFVSAVTVYSGEPIEIELEEPYEYYSVIGNSTDVNLTITTEGNNVTIIPNKYSQLDSYEVVFFNSEKETIIVYKSGGGGGGGGSSYGSVRTVEKVVTEHIPGNATIKEIEVEKIVEVKKAYFYLPWWLGIIILLMVGVILYFIFFSERGSNNNE